LKNVDVKTNNTIKYGGMKNNLYKPLITLILTCSLFTCIDPFGPKPDKFHSLLVVDSRLTNAVGSNFIRLLRTINKVNYIKDLNLPLFRYNSNGVEMGVDDSTPPLTPSYIMNFDKIYAQYISSVYVSDETIHVGERVLSRQAFSAAACSDCTLQSGLIKPNFWIDL
jgi:hypothetical protein